MKNKHSHGNLSSSRSIRPAYFSRWWQASFRAVITVALALPLTSTLALDSDPYLPTQIAWEREIENKTFKGKLDSLSPTQREQIRKAGKIWDDKQKAKQPIIKPGIPEIRILGQQPEQHIVQQLKNAIDNNNDAAIGDYATRLAKSNNSSIYPEMDSMNIKAAFQEKIRNLASIHSQPWVLASEIVPFVGGVLSVVVSPKPSVVIHEVDMRNSTEFTGNEPAIVFLDSSSLFASVPTMLAANEHFSYRRSHEYCVVRIMDIPSDVKFADILNDARIANSGYLSECTRPRTLPWLLQVGTGALKALKQGRQIQLNDIRVSSLSFLLLVGTPVYFIFTP